MFNNASNTQLFIPILIHPEMRIAGFIHYKPRIAVAILDL